jgi:prepilin peptidase CpaA
MTYPVMLHLGLLFTAATALLFAAAHDVAVRTVPNLVSVVVAAAGLGLQSLSGQLVPALFGAGLLFAGCWYCWRRGWIGGGDVKLLTACALLVPPTSVPELILTTAIAGGVLALLYFSLARLLRTRAMPQPTGPPPTRLLARIWRAERRRIRHGLSLPYACAICAGVLLTLNVAVPAA